MNNSQGALYFGAGIDTTQWRRDIESMRRDILGLNNSVKNETKQMDSSFKNLSIGIAGYFSASALLGFTQQLINVRGEFQKTEIAFSTMLGDGGKATELMSQMVDLAAKTPFSLSEVANGAKQLLAFQIPADQVVDTLTRMGNIAAGLSVPLSRINLVYGQVKAKGKLMGDDLRQFTEAGIPMVAELAKKFGTSTAEITKMVSAGKIGFKDVQDVLFNLTNEGGMFYNLMEKQSQSLSGQIANLGDSWDQMLNKIGEANEGILSRGIEGLNYLVEHYADILDILTVLVATYGTYRAALIATVAVQRTLAFAEQFTAAMRLAQGISGMTKAQILFNMAAKANPYVMAATAIAALTSAIYIYNSRVTEAEKAQNRIKVATDKYNDSIVETKTKIQTLVDQIKSENASNETKKKLLNQIHTLSNGRLNQLTIEAVLTGKATSSINEYVKALESEAKAKALQDVLIENNKRILQNQNKVRNNDFTAGDRFSAGFDSEVTAKLGQYASKDGTNKGAIIKASIENNKLWAENQKIAADLAKLGTQTATAVTETAEIVDDKVKKTKDKVAKQLAEIYSKGSIADLEQRISLWNEALSKSTGDKVEVLSKDKYGDTVKTGKNIAITDALKEVEALEKAKIKRQKEIQLLSFDEELSELERRIKARDQIIQSGYSKEDADSMFPDLAGKNLLKSLQELQANLNKEMSSGKGTEKTAENYNKVSASIDSLLGKQSVLDKFNKETELALSAMTTAGEKIIYLKELQSKMDGDEYTNGSFASTEENIRRILEAEQKSYQDLLIEHQSYEDKRNEIAKQATTKRIAILNDPKLNPEEKSKLTTSVTNQSNQQISDVALDELENSSAWQMLYQNIDSLTAYQIDRLLMALEENKDALASKMTPVDLRNVISKLRQAKQKLIAQNPFQGLVTSFKIAIKGFGAETEEETQVAQENFEDAASAVQATYKKIGDAAGALEPFKDVIGESAADALQAIMSFSMSAITVALLTKTTLATIKASIQKGEWSSVILAILQIVMIVIKAVISLISWLWKMGDKKKEKQIKSWAKEVENLKNEYNALKDAIDRALGEDVYKNQVKIIANLREQQRIITDMRNKENDKKKTDDGKVNEYNNQLNDIDRQINEIYDNISQSIAQTNAKDLASNLADALIEAYGKGEDAATAFGKVADNVMKDAVKNALKMQLLEGPMQNVIKQLIKNMGFNPDGSGTFDGLTEEERAQIKAMMASASQNYMDALGAYSDLFGETASNASSLSGAVKGITEETASVLAGQMNSIRIMQGEALKVHQDSNNVLRSSLAQLTQIEINTRYLKLMYTIMSTGSKDGNLRAVGLI